MMPLEQIRNFFPSYLRDEPSHQKYMVKEYLQLMILDFLATSAYAPKLSFIGGTNLRLVKGIDRFSEDLDFDIKDLSHEEFLEMTDQVLVFLKRNGFQVEPRDKANNKLKAFRRNIFFPQFLFDLGLSGYRDERFLIKVEAQDQLLPYDKVMASVQGCGYFFSFPVPPDDVLCAMKLSALLSRHKGRDFYDAVFLMAQTAPNYEFLLAKHQIGDIKALKEALLAIVDKVDLKEKAKDCLHLLFNKQNQERILSFRSFIEKL